MHEVIGSESPPGLLVFSAHSWADKHRECPVMTETLNDEDDANEFMNYLYRYKPVEDCICEF